MIPPQTVIARDAAPSATPPGSIFDALAEVKAGIVVVYAASWSSSDKKRRSEAVHPTGQEAASLVTFTAAEAATAGFILHF
jgi:hypothetical protein